MAFIAVGVPDHREVLRCPIHMQADLIVGVSRYVFAEFQGRVKRRAGFDNVS